MKRLAAPLLIFSISVTFISLIAAYSVYMPVAAVDPLAVKQEMSYSLGKNNVNVPVDQNEVRSVDLSVSGSTVTGATVQFFKRTTGNYNVRTTVTLLDGNGNTISTGTACSSYSGTGTRTATITSFTPPVSIDSVYRVNVVIQRVNAC
jgi:heme/copper-type cytochrome/quinol oxidase subunit 3